MGYKPLLEIHIHVRGKRTSICEEKRCDFFHLASRYINCPLRHRKKMRKNIWVWVKIRYPNNWMVNTKLDIHICGPTSVFHFDPHPAHPYVIRCLWTVTQRISMAFLATQIMNFSRGSTIHGP